MAQGDRRPRRNSISARRSGIQPDLAEAHSNLANLLAGRHAYAEAAAHFEQALRADPKYAAAHHGYGLVLALTKQYARAVAALRTAVRLEPTRERLHTDIADVLAAAEILARRWRIRAALEADPNDFDAHFGLAGLRLVQGRTAQAIAIGRRLPRAPTGR